MILKGFKGNPKRFYSYVRGLQSIVENIPEVEKDHGRMIVTNEDTANELARCFQQMFTTDNCKNVENKAVATDSVKWRDRDVDFSQQAVKDKLLGLKTYKSAGPDGIHPILLKSCAAALTEPLSIIFHSSIATGKVPSDWKTNIYHTI